MGARARIAILATVTAGALCAAPVATGAGSAGATCGGTITQDVRLTADLVCDFGSEITIGADRVTLDLDGHAIVGGVVIVEGHDRVTIRDGQVLQVHLRDAHRNRLQNLDLTDGESAVTLTGSTRNVVEGSTILSARSLPVQLIRSDRNVVRNNSIRAIQNGPAVSLDEESDRNVIAANTVSASQGQGIGVGGSHNAVVGNTVSTSGSAGGTFPTEAIYVFGGQRNLVAFNDVGSDTDGILVTAAASRTIVAFNQADENGDDGIDADSATTTLRGNRSNDNGDLGIEAVAGVRDAGANLASGNGNPAQCLNVACG